MAGDQDTARALGAARDPREAREARETVVLLHGFAGSSADWDDLAEVLVDAGHAVVGIDLPGHGATGIPVDARRFAMDETVRDLALLPAALGFGQPHWVGYSMGARVALHLGLTTPDRVRSLVLESASPGISAAPERNQRRADDEAFAAAIEARGIDWFVEFWETVPLFETQSRLPRPIRDAQRERRLANRPAGLAGSLRGIGQGAHDYIGGRLGALERPTLLLAGGLDSKYSTLAQQMGAAIPGAEVTLISDAGHNIHLEKPEAFRHALVDWLRRIEASPSAPASLPA
jgi:2-succinyl-6-hydroxy-2,4-cyclohexadiene-1-carboxylate synthase